MRIKYCVTQIKGSRSIKLWNNNPDLSVRLLLYYKNNKKCPLAGHFLWVKIHPALIIWHLQTYNTLSYQKLTTK